MHVPHSGGTSLFFAFYVKFCPKLPRAVVDNGTQLFRRKMNIVFGQALQAEFPPAEYCGGTVHDAVQAWRGTVSAGVTAIPTWKPYFEAYSQGMAKVRKEHGRAALLQAMEASQWKTEHGPYFPYQGVGFTMLRDPFNFLKSTFFKPKPLGHFNDLTLPGCGLHGESCTNLTGAVLAAVELAADPFDTFACWPGVFGCQTRMLLGRPCYDPEQLPFSEEDVDRARRTIEGFGFVGVTEEFGRSICLFDAMFPGPAPATHDFHRSSPDPRRRAGVLGSPHSRVVGASELSAGGGPRSAGRVWSARCVPSSPREVGTPSRSTAARGLQKRPPRDREAARPPTRTWPSSISSTRSSTRATLASAADWPPIRRQSGTLPARSPSILMGGDTETCKTIREQWDSGGVDYATRVVEEQGVDEQ
ncbi:hypothetical protein M885DRAFT_533001 [Pelagophyceae sp. CCMP2097]|nr:hypothetical protein M885DRAFT_533001 [Pelagophyceae sp. CCMP2097]